MHNYKIQMYCCLLHQVDKGSLWLFEQEQALGFSNVTTVVRMTVIKLKSGGLWVHAPIAPTRYPDVPACMSCEKSQQLSIPSGILVVLHGSLL